MMHTFIELLDILVIKWVGVHDPGDIPAFEDHLHSLFKVVHVGPLATGIQALVFLFQVMESRQAVSGRFYQALYAKMMDPALKHSNTQASEMLPYNWIESNC